MTKFIDTTDLKSCEEANKEKQSCSSDECVIMELCERKKLNLVYEYLTNVKRMNNKFNFNDFIRVKEFLK